MRRFKVKTEDMILFTTRVIVAEAASKEALLEEIKTKFPNSKVLNVEEVDQSQ